MVIRNSIEYKLYGRYALFTDPLTKLGGEKFTYPVPTYQALKGVTESLYWKPTLQWYIDDVRIMKSIQTQSQGIRPIHYQDNKNDLSIYTYLSNVEYQVRAHFEWNENRRDLIQDRNENKHHNIAKRFVRTGGRRDIFLGTRECQGYVEECVFGEGVGYYDDIDMSFGMMLHSITYPDECFDKQMEENMVVNFWNVQMKGGCIHFERPESCEMHKVIGKRNVKKFDKTNFSGLKEFEKGGIFDGMDAGIV
jgi:CRISPR-associated protein Cas5, subtype I-C/DVULG